jgi:TolB-like protein/Flp pilus assembly protein TadD
MVTGYSAFVRASVADSVAAVLTAEPQPMSECAPDISSELERIVARCLQKRASERFQSAPEVASALRLILQSPTPSATKREFRMPAKRRVALWIVAGALPIALAAFLLYPGGPYAGGFTESLAILPIVNQSGDANLDYVGDGITESLIGSMSQLPQVKVMARTTAFGYKGKHVDPQTAGRELGVRRVLTGKLLRQPDGLSVQVQLINVADGARLWEGRYLDKTTELLSVPAAISGSIASTLRLQLSAAGQKRLGKQDTRNQEAYQLCLRGRYYFNQRDLNERDALKKAIECFQQAIDKDPLYAMAYVGLAEAYDVLPRYTSASAVESDLKAKAAALKALEIDDTTGPAYVSLASVLQDEWNWSEAEKDFRRALLLNPGYATGHNWYGECLLFMGRTREALSELRLAAELDPLSPHIAIILGSVLYSDRQYDQAIEAAHKVLEMNPESGMAYIHIALCHLARRRFAEATVAIDRAANLMPGYGSPLALRAYVDAQTGNRQAALGALAKVTATTNEGRGTAFDLPAIYVGLGDKDAAFEALNRACDRRLTLIQELKVEPLFDPLRSDPRYPLLLRRMNLTP